MCKQATKFFFAAVVALFWGGCASSPGSGPQPNGFVCPGQGYGAVRLGMTREEVVAAIGQPELKVSSAAYQYADGFAVVFDRSFRVSSIMCGGWCEGDKPMVDRFRGSTASGIGMGSSSSTVRKAYGAPEGLRTVEGDPNFSVMEYPSLGVAFAFRHDRLVKITVSKSKGP
jgi:hypothetical protein